MIKIVEAISDTNIGGAGVLLLNRLKYTNRKVFDTTVIVPKGSMLIPKLKALKINVVSIDGTKNSSFDLKSLGAYVYAIRKIRPDIINCHASLNARIAGRLSGVKKCIYTRHCVFAVNGFLKYGMIGKCIGMFTDILSDGIIAVADAAKENLIQMGVKDEKIAVIINGAEQQRKISEEEKAALREKLKIGQDKTVVGIFARLEPYKNHECFLKAARVLCNKSDKYRFLIVGDGSQKKALEALTLRLDLTDFVVFTGFADDIAPYMNITDINVNCSTGTETSSLSLSEGMSLGIPCVVSDYGGNPYMVQNGVNGYIYKKGNYKELSRAILRAEENYAVLSKNAKKRFINELNSKSMALKTQKYYLQILTL